MTKTNKYTRGLCRWPNCNQPRDIDKDSIKSTYEDSSCILPFYCKEHGIIAVANRERQLWLH